jgi:hypothetical protein
LAVINVDGIIEEVDALWKQFEKVQQECSSLGATDTEPDWQFENAVRIALRDDKVAVPTTADGWELFTTQAGAEAAARKLHDACRPICELVQLHRGRSQFFDHVKGKLWRVDV